MAMSRHQLLLGPPARHLPPPPPCRYPPRRPGPVARRPVRNSRADPRHPRRPLVLGAHPLHPQCKEPQRAKAARRAAICLPGISTQRNAASQRSLHLWTQGRRLHARRSRGPARGEKDDDPEHLPTARGMVRPTRQPIPPPHHPRLGIDTRRVRRHHRLRRCPLHRTATRQLPSMGLRQHRSPQRSRGLPRHLSDPTLCRRDT